MKLVRVHKNAKAVVAALGMIVLVLKEELGNEVLSLDGLAAIISTGVVAVGTVIAVWGVKNEDIS